MFEIKRYTQADAAEWDCFVPKTRSGTFLFIRSYMDYHADRFHDHSLMIYRKGRLCALLPANESDATFYSHQGLTYGSLLTAESAGASDVCEIFRRINSYLKSNGFKDVIYKAVPWIYHSKPAEEDLYALFSICNARLLRREIGSTLTITGMQQRFTESRRSGLRKATASGIVVSESTDFCSFWHILTDNLSAKYSAVPVHSVEEIELLHSRFPDNIRLYMAYSEDGIPLAGTVIYECGAVVHTQYISASAEGKQQGALDLLFDHIINNVYCDHFRYRFFDFGTSTLCGGKQLNQQLIFQKEGFGGRGICYDTYQWEL